MLRTSKHLLSTSTCRYNSYNILKNKFQFTFNNNNSSNNILINKECFSYFKQTYATGTTEKVNIFNTELKKRQRSYVAKLEDSQSNDYLFDEVGSRLFDRVFDIKNVELKSVLDFGSRHGPILKEMDKVVDLKENQDFEYYMVDTSSEMLYRDEALDKNYKIKPKRVLVKSMEEPLPFSPKQFDLIISNLSIHWMNDLPGIFAHLHSLLKPNGVFLASLLGEETLTELKDSLYLADIERHGGFSPHISPFAKLSDIGNLLSKAKFNLPTVDTEKIVIKYGSMFTLMKDLQLMGENNATIKSRVSGGRDHFLAAQSIYQTLYGNDDGSLPATFQVIYLIGWSPHHSQQKPLPRGSAKRHLSEISDNSINIKLGDHVNNNINLNQSCNQTKQQQPQPQQSNPQENDFDSTILEPVPKTDDFIIKRLDKHGNLHEVNNPEKKDKNDTTNNNDNDDNKK